MVRTRVGYTGGRHLDPTYHDLGDHTEALQIDFDPQLISYRELLRHFWAAHHPTGPAWSTQYKAAVFVHDRAQRGEAVASRDRVAADLGERIRTEILAAGTFYVAEDYHQKWSLRRRGGRWLTWLREHYPDEADFRDSTAAARLNGWLNGGAIGWAPSRISTELGLPPAEAERLRREIERR